MLNERDLKYMRESHESIYKLREKPVTLFYEVAGKEDVFGNPIKETKSVDVMAVVTHMSPFTNLDKEGFYGYIYEAGDVKVDVREEYIDISLELPIKFAIEDYEFTVLYGKPKGIGERNRMEFFGRRVT